MSLTVVPLGGLCNRLRALLSAQALSAQWQVEVNVQWGRDKDCMAGFEDLFLPVGTPSFTVASRPWWNVPALKRNLFLPALFRRLAGYRRQFDCFSGQLSSELTARELQCGRHYLSSGSSFFPYGPENLRQLQLRPALQQRVDTLRAQFAPHTVGVHIRRTDNLVAIRHSSEEAFRLAIDREISMDSRVRFFLATDDEALKHRLLTLYPDRLIVQPTSVRRDTLQGMYEAAVDLYCLASTSRLIGSYWSSFTDTAAELGCMPVHIVGQEQASTV